MGEEEPVDQLFYISNFNTDAVKACLQSPCAIDLLHYMSTPLYISKFLPLIADRVLSDDHGPDSLAPDTIDWGQNNCGKRVTVVTIAFLVLRVSYALFNWMVVKNRGVPYYLNYPEKIPITCEVCVVQTTAVSSRRTSIDFEFGRKGSNGEGTRQ